METTNKQTQELIAELRALINGAQAISDSFTEIAVSANDFQAMAVIEAATVTNKGILDFLDAYERSANEVSN